jgi:ComF family protein
MKIHSFYNKTKNFLIDILFPLNCNICQARNEIICNDCVKKIQITNRETSGDIFAMFDYQDIRIKDIIWKLKYHHKHYLGEKLGQLLYEFFIEDISDIKTHVTGRAILVIPVPISNNKIKSRGYNQANAIARGFCDMANNDILLFKKNIIIKRIDTIPQAKITNRKRRLENVRGVFEIKNPEIVKGRTIVVIDDVTTTGGTISEIIKILKKAGAKKVVGFAVAH